MCDADLLDSGGVSAAKINQLIVLQHHFSEAPRRGWETARTVVDS